MTLSDPNPDFKVTVYLEVEYLKNGAFVFFICIYCMQLLFVMIMMM